MNTKASSGQKEHVELLERYARLIAIHGLNVQPGQLVNVSTEVYHREFLQVLIPVLYDLGASFVHVDLIDPFLQRARILHSKLEFLDRVPGFYGDRFNELVETKAANLKLLGPENPDYLADLDPASVNRIRKAAYSAAKRFYDEGIEKSQVHWCVAAAPTKAWAQRIFPDLEGHAAEDRLWEEIFRICRVDKPDFLERWTHHNALLAKRAEKLTTLGISELHFTGPGTDLFVGLSPRAVFRGGREMGPYGVPFEPNLPTEECFTTPDWRKTRGQVRATRPFLVNGHLVKGLTMTFAQGELQHFECESGKESFEAYLSSDEGAKRLGEVALVGIDSPIYQSGLVFEEILFDENAACHIAIGSAYRSCLVDGPSLSDEECEAIGCNTSTVHTDIMISSENVDINAILRDGSSVRLLSGGAWSDRFSS